VGIRSIVLLSPSAAAAVEWPRRLAAKAGAQAALYPMRVVDLARTIAEPTLLGRGLRPWNTGHAALIASRLLDEHAAAFELPADLPRAPIAAALARTLMELRRGRVADSALLALLQQEGLASEDKRRLEAVSRFKRLFDAEIEERFADPTTLLRAAGEHVGRAAWLAGAQFVLLPGLKLEADERAFIEELSERFEVLELLEQRPPGLSSRKPLRSVRRVPWAETPLAPAAPAAVPPALQRLCESLFEPLRQDPVVDESVELRTAPGEAAEVRDIVRRLIAEAASGVPFEEMAVALARPESYAPLFTDLLTRIGVPHRLHPSLPLRFGRSARSLLLLFRCRGLARSAVMEFLTFAPIPFAEILEREDPPPPARWDEMSRDAGIVSELPRWSVGLDSYAAAERASQEEDPERRALREGRARDAQDLLRIVKRLAESLEKLDGQATFSEWSVRLHDLLDHWLAEESDREAVADVINDLPALDAVAGTSEARASWHEVEAVLEARFEWERLPLVPAEGGAVHIGALDAIAGLPFRVVAIPGLVEGGFPGTLRPDPFLLDAERERLVPPEGEPEPVREARSGASRQLSLFDGPAAQPAASGARLATSQDRLLEARGRFHRALSQATEKLILSYPRADPRTGRERLPSLFFIAAATALRGGPIDARGLHQMVIEQDPRELALEASLDPSERDRIRVEAGGEDAAHAVASGSIFFRQSRLASRARLSRELTAYDGWVAPLPAKLKQRLDPITAVRAMSASRLSRFSMCGFWYFLQYVLKLEPALEPEERKRLEPIERGSLFHDVAERFLRERRTRGELPVTATPAMRKRALEMADEALDGLVAGSPPRFLFLWERERRRFKELVVKWLDREERNGSLATPAHFEVAFGPSVRPTPGEKNMKEPLVIELGDGRELRVSGKIDRIDEREDGSLVLRDYKTGRAPKDDGGIFRGGRQLQIPFYILAAEGLFPEARVVEAFLDYVDGGRQVALDPSVVKGETFKKLLRGLSKAIAGGVFVQDPSACNICDFNIICGPKRLIASRLHKKRRDEYVQGVQRLREIE